MTDKGRKAKVHRADCWGPRKEKYAWLSEHDWGTTDWQKVHPRSEFYLFVPRDAATLDRYQKFIKVTDIFPTNVMGIQTHRDQFVLDFEKEELKRRLRTFLNPDLSDDFVREAFKLKDNRDWKLSDKRKLIQQDKGWQKKIVPCLYRPFDVRWLFYHYHAIDFGREDVMRHVLSRENLVLLVSRRSAGAWRHCFVTKGIAVDVAVSSASREANQVFPQFLYPKTSKEALFTKQSNDKAPNLSPLLPTALQRAYETALWPDKILFWIYAVLYSNIYRENYSGFLRIDFPRIPFTKDAELFQQLAALGEQLVDLHLLRSSELDPPIARFQGKGDTKVQTGKKGLRYEPEAQRVYINEEQFFEGVPPGVWEYQIGGYQVCHKWLKDRKDRCLTLEEIKTYCRIVTALEKTIQIQAEIDKVYPQVEKTLLPIHLESE